MKYGKWAYKIIFPVYDLLHFHLKFTAGQEGRGGVDRWPAKCTEGETEAGAAWRARCLPGSVFLGLHAGSLTSPTVLAKAMRSRLGDQTKKMISCGSCFSPTTRKDGKQVGKRNMGATLQ